MLKIIKGCFDKNYERAESNKDEYDKIKDIQFLVLDNMNSEYVKNAEFNVSEFDILLRYRSGNCLPTIITTNYNEEEFKENYGVSINSLLSARNQFISVKGEDYRIKKLNKTRGE